MKYYGLSAGHIGMGAEEEEGRQPPLTSAKRSFDIPALLPLHVALPFQRAKTSEQCSAMPRASSCRSLRYCCVLLQSNGTSSECWKCQHGQREGGRGQSMLLTLEAITQKRKHELPNERTAERTNERERQRPQSKHVRPPLPLSLPPINGRSHAAVK